MSGTFVASMLRMNNRWLCGDETALCLQHDINSPAKTGVGTPVYMAPEVILGGKHYDAKVSPQCIVYHAAAMCGVFSIACPLQSSIAGAVCSELRSWQYVLHATGLDNAVVNSLLSCHIIFARSMLPMAVAYRVTVSALQKADLWSCGVILFALVFGRYPFDTAQRHFARKVVKGEYQLPEDVLVSDECRSLIKRMLVVEPNQRICIDEILTQPWFCADLPPAAREMNNFYVAHRVDLQEVRSS